MSITGSTQGTDTAVQAVEPWTVRALFARHKAVALGILALVLVLIAFTVGGILSSRPLVVTDSTTCSTWGQATFNEQNVYAAQFLREHGSLPSGPRDKASVVRAITNGCMQAYANDAQDTATILSAAQQ